MTTEITESTTIESASNTAQATQTAQPANTATKPDFKSKTIVLNHALQYSLLDEDQRDMFALLTGKGRAQDVIAEKLVTPDLIKAVKAAYDAAQQIDHLATFAASPGVSELLFNARETIKDLNALIDKYNQENGATLSFASLQEPRDGRRTRTTDSGKNWDSFLDLLYQTDRQATLSFTYKRVKFLDNVGYRFVTVTENQHGKAVEIQQGQYWNPWLDKWMPIGTLNGFLNALINGGFYNGKDNPLRPLPAGLVQFKKEMGIADAPNTQVSGYDFIKLSVNDGTGDGPVVMTAGEFWDLYHKVAA